MSRTTCPVFSPTHQEMHHFLRYIESIERQHPNIGICKIIPPESWMKRNVPPRESFNDISSLNFPQLRPIKQMVKAGKPGVLSVDIFEEKPMSVQELYEQCRIREFPDCEDWNMREQLFWKSFQFGNTSKWMYPLYGADLQGSVFENKSDLQIGRKRKYQPHLPGASLSSCVDGGYPELLRGDMLRMLEHEVPGVNTSMLYVGGWRAMFAYHVEDYDLYSINYLHTGANKSWYSVPPQSRQRFEAVAASYFGEDELQCTQFLRHKTKMLSPKKLHDANIPYHTVLQSAGEFVVTFPGAYHAGFNHGFNIAEATNFATPRWLVIGRKARRCECRNDGVSLNLDDLETLYRRNVIELKIQQTKEILVDASKRTSDDEFYWEEEDSAIVSLQRMIDEFSFLSSFSAPSTRRNSGNIISIIQSPSRKSTNKQAMSIKTCTDVTSPLSFRCSCECRRPLKAKEYSAMKQQYRNRPNDDPGALVFSFARCDGNENNYWLNSSSDTGYDNESDDDSVVLEDEDGIFCCIKCGFVCHKECATLCREYVAANRRNIYNEYDAEFEDDFKGKKSRAEDEKVHWDGIELCYICDRLEQPKKKARSSSASRVEASRCGKKRTTIGDADNKGTKKVKNEGGQRVAARTSSTPSISKATKNKKRNQAATYNCATPISLTVNFQSPVRNDSIVEEEDLYWRNDEYSSRELQVLNVHR